MKRLLSLFLLLALFAFNASGQSVPSAVSLPYSENFDALPHASTSLPSGWVSHTVGPLSTSFLTTYGTADFAITASATANTSTNNVLNFHQKIGSLVGGSNGRYPLLAISTTGLQNITVTFTIMTVRVADVSRVNEVQLQYLVSSAPSGTFTGIGTTYATDNSAVKNTAGDTSGVKRELITVTLPAACDNQSVVQLRWATKAQSATGGPRPAWAIDNISVTGTPLGGPSISVSTTSLPSFGNVVVGDNSTSQTYTVSGDNLTADVTVTAPAQFEISTDNFTFSSSLILTQSGGDLVDEPVTVFARFSPTATGAASGNITHTSPSATTQNVGVSGTGVNPPATYTWNVDADGDYQVASNWNPSRTTPAINDILVFDGSSLTGTRTISNLPASETIAQLRFINNANIVFTADAANSTLNIGGGLSGDDFEIASGSSLRLDTTANDRNIILSIATGNTGLVNGTFEARGAAHGLRAPSASALTVNGTVATLIGFTGNLFGATALNSVVFTNGAVYDQGAGSNPFGATAPNSVVVWQSGSLYRFTAPSGAPAFSGRTYANFEYDSPQTINATGTNPLTLNNLTVTSGTLNLNLTGGITINGDLQVSSGATLGFNPASANTLTFWGSSQSLSSDGTLTFNNNTNIVVNSTDLTTSSPITVPGNFTANGEVFGEVVIVGGTITNPGNIGELGLVPFNLAASTPFSSSALGIDIAAGDALNDLTLRRSIYPVEVGLSLSIDRRWTITSTTPSFAARTVTFTWPVSANNGRNPATFQMWKSTDGGDSWFAIPATFNISGDPMTATITASSFSEFTVSDGDNPLPVQLNSFTGVSTMRGVELAWNVASEQDNAGFIVLRNGQQIAHYNTTPELRGRGTTSEAKTYRYVDVSGLQVGSSYTYTLRSVDLDGTIHDINRTVVVQVTQTPTVAYTYKLEQNYPNPFNPSTRITFSIKNAGFVSLKVYDLLGREVATLVSENRPAGIYDVAFNASNLGSGIYFYTLTSGGFSQTKKMLFVK